MKKQAKKRKVRPRFYVGAPRMAKEFVDDIPTGMRWLQPTLGEAVAHAGRVLAADPGLSSVIVVQVVRVVRRPKPKFVVEPVR